MANTPLPPEELELPDAPEESIETVQEQSVTPDNLLFGDYLDGIEVQGNTTVAQIYQDARKARLAEIEKERDSLVIAYYSVHVFDMEDASQLWDVLSSYPDAKNIDLFILSPGGMSNAAFKVSRMFQEYTQHRSGKFGVLIPYYAKSAATILSLGADEIVMGQASELGPIDPQIPRNGRYVPLLALHDAIEYLKNQAQSHPNTASLFWPLVQRLELLDLGEYQREIDSAEQYARQLLESRMFAQDVDKARICANKLVTLYKSHRHVIDRHEARTNLGLNVVDASTSLYNHLWQLHKLYERMIRKSFETGRPMKIIETSSLTVTRPVNVAGGPSNSIHGTEGVWS